MSEGVAVGVGEYERKEALEALRRVIDVFLEGQLDSFDIHFSQYLEVRQDEFEDLIGNPDSSNGVVKDEVFDDEYTYDISEEETSPGKCIKQMKKLFLHYHVRDDDDDRTYVIHYAGGFTDNIEIECPDTSDDS